MDRTRAFVEYGRILDETMNWLVSGYRQEYEDMEVIPPMPKGRIPSSESRPSFGSGEASPMDGPQPDRPAQLLEIAEEVGRCRLCDLYLTRRTTVPGQGSVDVPLMVIGPPPTREAGENDGPLSPKDAEYLSRWLAAVGLDISRDIFITPALKCRTPGGRAPRPMEASACRPYLERQAAAVRPRALLVLGSSACGALTGDPRAFRRLSGRDWQWSGIPALILWTPAEVLADPEGLRRPVWEGLKRLKAAWDALR